MKEFLLEVSIILLISIISLIGAASCILSVANNVISASSTYTFTFRPTATSTTAKNLSKFFNFINNK